MKRPHIDVKAVSTQMAPIVAVWTNQNHQVAHCTGAVGHLSYCDEFQLHPAAPGANIMYAKRGQFPQGEMDFNDPRILLLVACNGEYRLITLEEPTGPMKTEALEAGYYRSEFKQWDYPKIQIITIKDLLHGKEPQLPPHFSPYRLAERKRRNVQQPELFDRRE